MKAELIVALDISSSSEIGRIVDRLPSEVLWYKVGLELFIAEGPAALEPLRARGKRIFLDLKLHDIPNTVARAVASAARHGVHLLTVHAGGGAEMLRAAAAAAGQASTPPKLVAVTTLTSLNDGDLKSMGVCRPLREHTLGLGELAVQAGIDGVVCSVHEAASFRERLGARPLLVTPGIRPAGGSVGDQKRVATPAAAVQAGASFLVVGRPILDAADPGQAARDILREIQQVGA